MICDNPIVKKHITKFIYQNFDIKNPDEPLFLTKPKNDIHQMCNLTKGVTLFINLETIFGLKALLMSKLPKSRAILLKDIYKLINLTENAPEPEIKDIHENFKTFYNMLDFHPSPRCECEDIKRGYIIMVRHELKSYYLKKMGIIIQTVHL